MPSNIPTLDLHGVKHADVPKKCDKFMTSIWGKCEWADIITGNSDTMKFVVKESLRDYDIEVRPTLANNAVLRVYF